MNDYWLKFKNLNEERIIMPPGENSKNSITVLSFSLQENVSFSSRFKYVQKMKDCVIITNNPIYMDTLIINGEDKRVNG